MLRKEKGTGKSPGQAPGMVIELATSGFISPGPCFVLYVH